MKITPFLINQNSDGEPLKIIEPANAGYDERWLQELLILQPSILPVSEIEPVFHPLIPIGREVPTDNGYIDNLFISQQGYPVLVETKLWRNPDAKRDVLAQSIGYGASLSEWTFGELDATTRKFTQQYEGKPLGLVEWIEQHEPLEVDPIYFEETVNKNLRLGRLLILIVGDRIRSTVVDMVGYINKFPHLALNVALVELQCYQMQAEEEWPLIVFPSLLAKTKILERSIMQVNVSLDGSYKVEVSPEKMGKEGKATRSSLTEDEFWNRLKDQAPNSYPPVHQLIEYYRQRDEVQLRPRSNSIAAHLYAPESGQRISLFFVRTDGVIECWHATISDQLEKGGLRQELLEQFINDLAPLLCNRTKTLSLNYPAEKVDIDKFISVVDQFIDHILQAEPDLES